MVAGMTDQDEPRRPQLTDLEGNPIEIGVADDVARVFAESVNNAADDSSPPYPDPSLWWSLRRPDGGGMHIKVTAVDYDRWVITDVYVHGQSLSATDLQAVPLTQLELVMNLLGYWGDAPGAGKTRPPADAFMDGDVIADFVNDLAAKAGYGATAMYVGEEDEEPTLADLREHAADAPEELLKSPAAERPRLTRPDGTDPDGFAEKVAAAYREYAIQTRAPAVEIAKEAGVPVGTVRGWIREARRRGKLPHGQKGKVG